MEWIVEKQLVCPQTKTYFALAVGARNLKLIFWYKGSYFIRADNHIKTTEQDIWVNDKVRDIEIIHIFPFNPPLWNTFKSSLECPGNDADIPLRCARDKPCLFELCPYGLKVL
ncbi:anti-adapter protein iraM [Atlantibacter hermannii]|uniref:anti-adapter protein iraM n=1 Tax=Atlantibacter hermannii TaxID=565 RepID=UPI0028A61F6B|nr:anti-adapter protein iraM [Atlantibacter hermannii]